MFTRKDLQAKKNQPRGRFLPVFFTWTLQKCRSAFLGFKRRSKLRAKSGLVCVGLNSAKNAKTLRLNVHLNTPKCPAKSAADCKSPIRRVGNRERVKMSDSDIKSLRQKTKALCRKRVNK